MIRALAIFTRNVPRAFLCTGTIPASIGGLINLQSLDLSRNSLEGTAYVCLVLDQCLHREWMRETGEKHRERIKAHAECSPRVPSGFSVTKAELQQLLPNCGRICV